MGTVEFVAGEARSSAEARISAMAFWEEVSLLVSSLLFFLAGLAVPEALTGPGGWQTWQTWQAGVAAAGILATVIALGWLDSLVSTRLPPLAAALAGEHAAGRAAAAGVMAWASTRSVLGLVVVLSVPRAWPDGTPFAEGGLLLVVVALVVLSSVGLQGLTLLRAARAAALQNGGDTKQEETRARTLAARARESAGAGDDVADANGLAAERRTLLDLRERDEIGDEELRNLLREGDLRKRAAEGDAEPGAPPPRP
ncbi:hypothetical protein [Muricoccus aerilatus]|uniref:hypothetical protein n=1 Tax=Muricoccus aerilatus TaxID=452982 RepID=UPI000693D552|nr:hypothetical protein [Roseomonas aerilata]